MLNTENRQLTILIFICFQCFEPEHDIIRSRVKKCQKLKVVGRARVRCRKIDFEWIKMNIYPMSLKIDKYILLFIYLTFILTRYVSCIVVSSFITA